MSLYEHIYRYILIFNQKQLRSVTYSKYWYFENNRISSLDNYNANLINFNQFPQLFAGILTKTALSICQRATEGFREILKALSCLKKAVKYEIKKRGFNLGRLAVEANKVL